MSELASYLDDVPVGRTRKRVVRFVLAVLALQLFVPLTYYLQTGDPYDERFAWRMFSAVRMYSCRTTATETVDGSEQAISLSSTLHQAWVNHLARNRRDVVVAFLEAHCDEEGVTEVTVRNECTAPDGRSVDPQVYHRDCASGEVELPDALEEER